MTQKQKKENTERDQAIMQYYGVLQGAKAIPFGLFLFFLAFRDLGPDWLQGQLACVVTGTMVLAMFVGLFIIDSYYMKYFGKVRPTTQRSQMKDTIYGLMIFAALTYLENLLTPPVSLLGLTIAILFFVIGTRSKRYYYLPLGVAILVASVLPLFLNTTIADPIFGSLGFVTKIVIGVAIIIAGLVDHFFLMRVLKSMPLQVRKSQS